MTVDNISIDLFNLPLAYDGEDEDKDKGKDEDILKDPKIQEAINKAREEENRKARDNQEKLIKELEHLKKTSNMSSDQRKKLDQRLESLQNELLTTKEQAEREQAKAKQEHEAALTKAIEERNSAASKYENLLIQNELITAANSYKAYNPDQVISQIRGHTKLTPVLDDEGSETGQMQVMVDITTTDSEGKEVTLSVAPKEAVKRMAESEKHANLFVAKGADGLGYRPTGKAGKNDAASLAKNPAEYIKARKEGRI